MTLTLGINGACGRMGLAVGRLIYEDKNTNLDTALENTGSNYIGKDYGIILGLGKLGVLIQTGLSNKIDALIDFSTPSAAMQRIDECIKFKVTIVICTTGLSKKDLSIIKAASKKIPCLISSNMSIGINLLFKLCPDIAKKLGNNYDIAIVESHHRFKKDAPSGTAKTFKENIVNSGLKKDVPIHSIRAGDIVGEHTITYSTIGETIEITHRAHSRDIFAQGAIAAAKFLAQAKQGLYTMQDVIKGSL